jgi:hypothetical protein
MRDQPQIKSANKSQRQCSASSCGIEGVTSVSPAGHTTISLELNIEVCHGNSYSKYENAFNSELANNQSERKSTMD